MNQVLCALVVVLAAAGAGCGADADEKTDRPTNTLSPKKAQFVRDTYVRIYDLCEASDRVDERQSDAEELGAEATDANTDFKLAVIESYRDATDELLRARRLLTRAIAAHGRVQSDLDRLIRRTRELRGDMSVVLRLYRDHPRATFERRGKRSSLRSLLTEIYGLTVSCSDEIAKPTSILQ